MGTCHESIHSGNIENLEWVIANGCPTDGIWENVLCHGRKDVLTWAQNNLTTEVPPIAVQNYLSTVYKRNKYVLY
jgi:hypothetical protein